VLVAVGHGRKPQGALGDNGEGDLYLQGFVSQCPVVEAIRCHQALQVPELDIAKMVFLGIGMFFVGSNTYLYGKSPAPLGNGGAEDYGGVFIGIG